MKNLLSSFLNIRLRIKSEDHSCELEKLIRFHNYLISKLFDHSSETEQEDLLEMLV